MNSSAAFGAGVAKKKQTRGVALRAEAAPRNIQLSRVLKSGGLVEVTKEELARQAAP